MSDTPRALMQDAKVTLDELVERMARTQADSDRTRFRDAVRVKAEFDRVFGHAPSRAHGWLPLSERTQRHEFAALVVHTGGREFDVRCVCGAPHVTGYDMAPGPPRLFWVHPDATVRAEDNVDTRALAEARIEQILGEDAATRDLCYFILYNAGLRIDTVRARLQAKRWV